jgi:hypothetical protein
MTNAAAIRPMITAHAKAFAAVRPEKPIGGSLAVWSVLSNPRRYWFIRQRVRFETEIQSHEIKGLRISKVDPILTA